MIAGLLLASGSSRRFGSDKLLARLGDRTVVRWSAEALAAAVDSAYVVTPTDAAALRAELQGVRIAPIENAASAEGIASSIRAGVAALPSSAEAVVITLADQPTIDPRVIRDVVAAWRVAPAGVRAVTTSYADGRSHPTLFSADCFAGLLALQGDRGARDLLAALGDAVTAVDVGGAQPPDVDTPEDLAATAELVARRA